MSGDKKDLEKIAKEIEELRKGMDTRLLDFQKYITLIIELLNKILALLIGPQKDYVCADPHGTWDGHLNGAYAEGDDIKKILESVGHFVVMDRHPVKKADFIGKLTDKNIIHLTGHGGFEGSKVLFCFDDDDVYPEDIDAAMSSGPSKLFFAGTCLGGTNETMAKVFKSKGTQFYVGFTESIPDLDARYFDKLVYEKWLVDGKDLRTALDEADDSYPALSCWVLWE